MKIKVFTTGGTIDKIYFDRKSEFEVGAPQIGEVLESAGFTHEYEVEALMHKDSLEITDEDRRLIHRHVERDPHQRFLITHGTDTMARTAETLQDIPDKTIVLTGSLQPARFQHSDAIFNIGCAVAAVQILPPGAYVAMNGGIFKAGHVRKNQKTHRFESI